MGEIEAQPAAETNHRDAVDPYQVHVGVAAAQEQAADAAERTGLVEGHARYIAQQVHGEGFVALAHLFGGDHVHAGRLRGCGHVDGGSHHLHGIDPRRQFQLDRRGLVERDGAGGEARSGDHQRVIGRRDQVEAERAAGSGGGSSYDPGLVSERPPGRRRLPRRLDRRPCRWFRQRREPAKKNKKKANRPALRFSMSGSSHESRYVSTLSGRSPDLRFNGAVRLPIPLPEQWLPGPILHAYSSGAVPDFHRLPEHQRSLNYASECTLNPEQENANFFVRFRAPGDGRGLDRRAGCAVLADDTKPDKKKSQAALAARPESG